MIWRSEKLPSSLRVFIYLTHQAPKISTLHSPITNLEHPFALSISDDAVVRTPLTQAAGERLVIASA